MESLEINYHAILPETITASVAVLIMMIDAMARKIERRVAGAVSLLGLIAAGVAVVSLWGRNGETSFKGMIITDDFRLFFAMIFLVVSFLTVLISLRWVEDEVLPTGEYFALLMFATTGMLFMSAANDLVITIPGQFLLSADDVLEQRVASARSLRCGNEEERGRSGAGGHGGLAISPSCSAFAEVCEDRLSRRWLARKLCTSS